MKPLQFSLQYESMEQLQAGNYTIVLEDKKVEYTFRDHIVTDYHAENDWCSGSQPVSLLPHFWQPNDHSPKDPPRWAPFGAHGFRHMFWTRYEPENEQMVFHFNGRENVLEEELQLLCFDKTKPPVYLEPSLRLWYLSPQRPPVPQQRIFIHHRTGPCQQDPHWAVLVFDQMNRIAVKRHPKEPHLYLVIMTLTDSEKYWLRAMMTYNRQGEFQDGYVVYGFKCVSDYNKVQEQLHHKLVSKFYYFDVPQSPLEFDAWDGRRNRKWLDGIALFGYVFLTPGDFRDVYTHHRIFFKHILPLHTHHPMALRWDTENEKFVWDQQQPIFLPSSPDVTMTTVISC